MVHIQTDDGRHIDLNREDAVIVFQLAQHFDAIIFWDQGGVDGGVLPMLMPRRLWQKRAPEPENPDQLRLIGS